MRIALLFLIFSWQTIFTSTISPVREFPSSAVDLPSFIHFSLTTFDQQIEDFATQPKQDATFAQVILQWDAIITPLFGKGSILTFLPITTKDPKLLLQGSCTLKTIQDKLASAMKHPGALQRILSFAKQEALHPTLHPHERYLLYYVLSTIHEGSFSAQAQEIQKQLEHCPMRPFRYKKGKLDNKILPKSRQLSILSWNVCLLEHNLSMLFGGVPPWQARIHNIAKTLLKHNPDIICLQEAFSPEANIALIEKLQTRYSHFYYHIGPKPSGFSLESLGIPSGLFIASKYALQDFSFTPYTKEQTPPFRGYGFVTAKIYNQDQLLGSFITTHLQPGQSKEDAHYRKLQMQAIGSAIDPLPSPVFLCGDLNIDKTSTEALELLANYQPSSYQGLDWTCCELRDYWWKSQENIKQFHALPPHKEWLDYFFCLKSPLNQQLHVVTNVLSANNLKRPNTSLSDHQILFTTIILSQR